MNNQNPHRSEPLPDERPFEGVIRRALRHQEDERIVAAQHRSAIPEYRITTRARDDLALAEMRKHRRPSHTGSPYPALRVYQKIAEVDWQKPEHKRPIVMGESKHC